MGQRILGVVIICLGVFIIWLLWRNRMSDRVLEASLAIVIVAITVVALRLQPEKHEAKFPFVYFFDWKNGSLIDLKVPGQYFLEDSFLSHRQEELKKRLKHESFLVTRDLSELTVLNWLGLTPFGSKPSPTSRIAHLGSISYGGGEKFEPERKTKEISAGTIREYLSQNLFTEIIRDPPLPHLDVKGIKIPPGARFDIVRHSDNGFTITIREPLWFDLLIRLRVHTGGIVTGSAQKLLALDRHKIDDMMNVYNVAGQFEIKWTLKRWSVGNPEIPVYREWLRGITDRLQDHFDWNRKSQSFHREYMLR
jgi:hypothetical protein